MIHLTQTRPAQLSVVGALSAFVRVVHFPRWQPTTLTSDTADLPADRLADMGIAPRTAANRRASWEYGPAPKAELR